MATDLRDAGAASDLFRRAAGELAAAPHRRGSAVRLPAKGRLLVSGDLHDNPEHLQRILHLAQLDAGPDHHVVLQEIVHGEALVNGMDLSHRMLARVAELVIERPAQVHVILGNHEIAQLCGHHVSKGAGDNVELFNAGLEFVFGDRWTEVDEAIKQFIAAMPLVLLSDSGVLCAHSLPAPRLLDGFEPDIIDRELHEADFEPRAGSAWILAWGRGWGENEVRRFRQAWDVRLLCVGHEHVENGIVMRGPHAIILNSDHEMGVVVPVDLADPPTAEHAMMDAIRLRAVALPGTA